jgi:hypothetical protein
MKLSTLVDRLKTFPPEHRLRFYCPTDKNFYHITWSNVEDRGRIGLGLYSATQPSRISTYGYWLGIYSNTLNIIGDKEFKFIIDNIECRML